jgi:uncharacterized membrane protein
VFASAAAAAGGGVTFLLNFYSVNMNTLFHFRWFELSHFLFLFSLFSRYINFSVASILSSLVVIGLVALKAL